ncbi:MAG: hypothetical protein HZA50_16080 [Planctomycetes bacterium]|nr:hypothetical protein [Planctomycetota bacterium]
MPTDNEHKLAAYWLLTGKLPPDVDASRVSKPEIKKAVVEMRQTILALKNWRDAHGKLPQLALKPVARRIFLWRWVVVGAAAAAVLAVCLIGLRWWNAPKAEAPQLAQTPGGKTPQTQPSPTQTIHTPELAREFAWTAQVEAPPQRPLAKLLDSIKTEEKLFGASSAGSQGRGGAPGEDPGLMVGDPAKVGGGGIPDPEQRPGVKGGPGGQSDNGSLEEQSALESFATQFTFKFRVPPQLPGGWEFSHARAVGENKVQLIYGKGPARLSVFLMPSAGSDLSLQSSNIGSPETIIARLAARKSGLALVFQGPVTAADVGDKVIDLFMPRKGK